MLLKYSLFDRYNLTAFTSTTQGGVSKGNYSSLNLSLYSSDNDINVLKNREILINTLELSKEDIFIPFQTHEDKVQIVDEEFLKMSSYHQIQALYGCDALITNQKGICIGITTADCVPILIYDPIKHILGTAHAGWKGTVLRIGVKTASKMVEEFGCEISDLVVAIGPSISPQMFEVGDEVGEAFLREKFNLDEISFRNEQTKKLHIDLWKANVLPLLEFGVTESNIEVAGICTFQDENYFSARRQTILSGRMVTGGVLK